MPQDKKKKKGIKRFLSFKKKPPKEGSDGASFVDNSLHNTLRKSENILLNFFFKCYFFSNGQSETPPIIGLAKESKLDEAHVPEDDSTDSFKSAGSPELRNRVAQPAVDTRSDSETTLTERAFTVFVDSEFVKDLRMSQRKERAPRGRGSLPKAETPQPEPEPEKVSEEPAKVSGDDLRKQLEEGLKNGSGKPKDVKAQLSEITQNAVKTSEEETQNFLETVRNEESKAEEPAAAVASTSVLDPDQLGLVFFFSFILVM